MGVVVLRMTLTPVLVLIVSLVQRRWGHALGGRLIGLPLTTGPFLVLVSLSEGTAATALAAHGVVAGQISVVAFCATYARVARRRPWWQALPSAWAVAFASVLVLQGVGSTWAAAAVVVGSVVVALRTWPTFPGAAVPERVPARWETPVRAVVTGFLVATLTGLARVLGPHLAGLLATTPVIVSVLGPATQRASGPAAASALLRGTSMSIAGSTMFSAVVAATIVPFGAAVSFVLALLALVATDLLLAWQRSISTAAAPEEPTYCSDGVSA
ncbi:MAG TPA: hypothetical protein VLV82_02505 [Candidatus Angelobacter sp.]|nr:hypothetical protein [Candidatus Angelobacter sp.]